LAFKKRNPDLALRTPEATGLIRATGFNTPQVDRVYDLLLQLQEQFGFKASQIYNALEMGVSTVHKNDKVSSVKGKHRLENPHQQKEAVTSLMFSTNVNCHFIPLMFIFPRKKWLRMVV
jgi:hypothetical protein